MNKVNRKVVKTYQMSREQCCELKESFHSINFKKRGISKLIMELFSFLDEEEKQCWNWAAEKFEYEDNQDLEMDDKSLKINWIDKKLELWGDEAKV